MIDLIACPQCLGRSDGLVCLQIPPDMWAPFHMNRVVAQCPRCDYESPYRMRIMTEEQVTEWTCGKRVREGIIGCDERQDGVVMLDCYLCGICCPHLDCEPVIEEEEVPMWLEMHLTQWRDLRGSIGLSRRGRLTDRRFFRRLGEPFTGDPPMHTFHT